MQISVMKFPSINQVTACVMKLRAAAPFERAQYRRSAGRQDQTTAGASLRRGR